MSQDSSEKLGVKSQISIGARTGGRGLRRGLRRREGEKREKGYVEIRTK